MGEDNKESDWYIKNLTKLCDIYFGIDNIE